MESDSAWCDHHWTAVTKRIQLAQWNMRGLFVTPSPRVELKEGRLRAILQRGVEANKLALARFHWPCNQNPHGVIGP